MYGTGSGDLLAFATSAMSDNKVEVTQIDYVVNPQLVRKFQAKREV